MKDMKIADHEIAGHENAGHMVMRVYN